MLWFDLGIVRAGDGQIAPAIDAFHKAASLLPDKRGAFQNIIALYLSEKDLTSTISTCRPALSQYPADVDILQNCGFTMMTDAHFTEALAPLRTLKHLMPNDVAVRVSIISALYQSGHSTESYAELKKLFASSLLSRDQALALAQDYATQNNPHAAELTLTYLAQHWPTLRNDVKTYASAGLPDAVTSTSAASTALSDSIEQAEALIRSEHYMDAFHFLSRARAQFPNRPELEYQSALTDVCLQRFVEAISTLQMLKAQEPPSARVEFLLGGSYEIEGDEKNAESAYRSASALDPNNFLYLRVLGALLQKEGRFTESSIPVQQALAMEPDDSQSLILLARSLEKAGSLDQATSLLENATRSDPGSRRAHSALALLYFRQKRLPEAQQQQAIAATLEDKKIQQWNIWGTLPNHPN